MFLDMTSCAAANSGLARLSFRSLRTQTAMGLVLLCTGAAMPAVAAQQGPLQLPEASVEDDAQQPYKPEAVESPKYTAPLLDTPQTVTVIPESVIKDQNLMSLRDVLSTVPGITFGAGEGGGGYGDSVNLRGFTANSDITVDGVRDSAQYTRSDPFNLEQIEVVNGANSVYGGSGSVGGTINIVSKTAKDTAFTTLSGGVGTDSYFRGTIDTNQVINESTAVRLNVMGHMQDMPGRKVEEAKRWGIAPSVAFGLGSPTRFTFNFVHQHDNNTPQYGVGYFKNAYNNGPVPGADAGNYYGYANMDQQRINLDAGTAIVTHDFDANFSLRNLTRYQQVTQFSLVNPPQGTWCVANGTATGMNIATGAACAAPLLPNTLLPSGPRGTTRATKNTKLYNQTDLMMRFAAGAIQHSTVFGVSVSSESFRLDNGNSQRTAAGATPTYPLMNITTPDTTYTGPMSYIQAGAQDGTLRNQAVYLFETAEITPQIELNGGMRYEHNEGTHTTATYSATGVFASQGPMFQNEDYLFSYRFGLVYKPIPDASIYAAYGNSKAPSKTSVNGACTAATCSVAPETAENYEFGAKWNLLDNRLSLTGSVFRNARTNFRVDSGDPIVSEQQLDGSARVDGLALGAAGTITPEWMVFTNYTYLRSKYLRSVSAFCLANPGVGTCTNTPGQPDPLAGRPLSDVPSHAFSLWTTYALPFNITAGYGATYQSSFTLRRGNETAFQLSKAYWIHRAMVSYAINQNLDLQLNANNIFDKKYYSRIRNNGWATPGDARQVTLTVNYSF